MFIDDGNDGPMTETKITDVTKTTHSFTGLSTGNRYRIGVQIVSDAGTSTMSDVTGTASY